MLGEQGISLVEVMSYFACSGHVCKGRQVNSKQGVVCQVEILIVHEKHGLEDYMTDSEDLKTGKAAKSQEKCTFLQLLADPPCDLHNIFLEAC